MSHSPEVTVPADEPVRKSLRVNFLEPEGAEALIAADSITWQVFKNPVAAFIGGVTAVILELSEPRVAAGVWGHTTFRTDPRTRLRRTGLAAMVTVYGPRQTAERMIAGVRRAHDRVRGTAADGQSYHANDPELLDWVQATASFGFVEAYSQFVRALSREEKDRFYAESVPPARLYGTRAHPDSLAAQERAFAQMRPQLGRTEIVEEFLAIMQLAEVLPRALRPLQRLFVRAAVDILPNWAMSLLPPEFARKLNPMERALVRGVGFLTDGIVLTQSPAAQACVRLGLPVEHLYRPGLLRMIRI